jgi:hypothetical protein
MELRPKAVEQGVAVADLLRRVIGTRRGQTYITEPALEDWLVAQGFAGRWSRMPG